MIWGAQDRFLGKEMTEQSMALVDQGRLRIVESATHWVQHEEPELVNEWLTEFFTAEPGAAGSGS
jgi:epoxide hydrolase 4